MSGGAYQAEALWSTCPLRGKGHFKSIQNCSEGSLFCDEHFNAGGLSQDESFNDNKGEHD